MARHKQVSPIKRQASDFEDQRRTTQTRQTMANGVATSETAKDASPPAPAAGLRHDSSVDKALAAGSAEKGGVVPLVICVGGIYASL